MNQKRIAILVSGSGTNMENLIRKMKVGEVPAQPCLVISDNPEAKAIERAKNLGVETSIVNRKDFPSKAAFEAEMIRLLEEKRTDLVALAGFMKILSQEFVRKYKGRLVNIHPAYLPHYPGAHGIRDSYEANKGKPAAQQKGTGVSVHYVDEGVDTGQVILQKKVPLKPSESPESFETRIHAVEYELYPEALRKILEIEDRK